MFVRFIKKYLSISHQKIWSILTDSLVAKKGSRNKTFLNYRKLSRFWCKFSSKEAFYIHLANTKLEKMIWWLINDQWSPPAWNWQATFSPHFAILILRLKFYLVNSQLIFMKGWDLCCWGGGGNFKSNLSLILFFDQKY